MDTSASQSQMNEGPHSWTPGTRAEIYQLSFWRLLVQIVPCVDLSIHAVFSDKAKPGGGWCGVLCFEASLCRAADCERRLETLHQTDRCWAPTGCALAMQQASVTNRSASLLTAYTYKGLTGLTEGRGRR